MNKLSVLDIGSGPGSVAGQVLARDGVELSIVRLDVDPIAKPDYVVDISQSIPEELIGAFDVVYASHVLEHIDRNKIFAAVDNMIKAIKNYGEFWLIVPSLEFACREILDGRDTPGIQGLLYGHQGTPWEYHRCAFTLKELRFVLESRGLVVRRAYQSPFTFYVDGQGHEWRGLQNVAIGMRYAGDASEALG